MKELKFFQDNWILVVTTFLILSMVGLSTTYGLVKFNILNYISFQDSISIFFFKFLRFDILGMVITSLLMVDLGNKNTDAGKKLFFGICFFFVILLKPEELLESHDDIRKNDWLYVFIILIASIILLLFFVGFVAREMFPYENKYRLVIYFTFLLIIQFYVMMINLKGLIDSKNKVSIIKFDQSQITTSKNLYIIFQSSDIIVLRDEIEKSNIVYRMENIKSLESCY